MGMACLLHAQEQGEAKQPDAVATVTITANQTITDEEVFDEATSVVITSNARFIKGENGRLIFRRPFNAPRSQLFEGFAPGDVVFEGKGCDAGGNVFPEWWGATASDDPTSGGVNVSAINAALASVANTPLAVSLSGVYYINNKVRPLSSSRLTAAERGAIKAVPNLSLPPGDYMVEIKGQSQVTIDGIEVDGNRANQTQSAAHAYGGIIAVNSNHCTIKNCKIHDCNGPPTGGAVGNGVRTHRATEITIADNEIYSNNGCGINLYNTSSKIRVVHNTIHNNCEIGIESEGRGENYKDYRNTAITIADNDIVGSAEKGRLDDHSVLVDWNDDVTITGNRCRNSTHNGIEVLGSSKVAISNNDCENNGDVGPPYTWAGIRITAEGFLEDGRSSDVAIRNNKVTGSQYGIYLDTVDRAVIHANTITDTVHGPLMIGPRASDVDISGNRIEQTRR